MYSERSLRERKPKEQPMMGTPIILSEGRKRKANFSADEKYLLVNGYKKFKDILGRDSDASLEKRAAIWQSITDNFNEEIFMRDGERAVKRTTAEVRKKWRAMCTQARKNRQDMAENGGNTDNYTGWLDKQYELDSEIMSLLGESEEGHSDDAWSEMGPESPVESKWTSSLKQSETRMPSHTLPVQAPRRVSAPANANHQGDVTPIILHTESLAEPLVDKPIEYVEEYDYIRKKRALELEKMHLENSLLRMQLTKATLEVQAMKADLEVKEDEADD